jgi:hypothetical protein
MHREICIGMRSNLHLASANDHGPEAKRRIRVIKESVCALRFGMPFSRLPRLMVIHMVFQCTQLLNYFPTMGGILDTISPRTLLLGATHEYKKLLRLSLMLPDGYRGVYRVDGLL